MKYKGILLDIDNTLYNYKVAHVFSKNIVLDYCVSEFSLPKNKINFAYEKARKQVHIELSETAASHNRLLYFQKMLEILNVNPMKYAIKIYSKYWNSFLNELNPFDEIYVLLEKYKHKICLVTDLTANIQYRKIQKLGLEKYCNNLVTSEEAGREKPHPYMFMLALQKLGLRADEVCMIGDNFKKDILGSAALGIESIWFNHEGKKEAHDDKLIREVREFKEILKLL
jgi:HAD superfamily hydrolase (TIGR01549 family)